MSGYAANGQRVSGKPGLSKNGKKARTIIVLAVLIALANQVLTWQSGSDLVSGQSAAAISSNADVQIHYITVRSGDTLWALANRYAPNQDTQVWINQVVAVNNLSSTEVSVGQRLAIPGH